MIQRSSHPKQATSRYGHEQKILQNKGFMKLQKVLDEVEKHRNITAETNEAHEQSGPTPIKRKIQSRKVCGPTKRQKVQEDELSGTCLIVAPKVSECEISACEMPNFQVVEAGTSRTKSAQPVNLGLPCPIKLKLASYQKPCSSTPTQPREEVSVPKKPSGKIKFKVKSIRPSLEDPHTKIAQVLIEDVPTAVTSTRLEAQVGKTDDLEISSCIVKLKLNRNKLRSALLSRSDPGLSRKFPRKEVVHDSPAWLCERSEIWRTANRSQSTQSEQGARPQSGPEPRRVPRKPAWLNALPNDHDSVISQWYADPYERAPGQNLAYDILKEQTLFDGLMAQGCTERDARIWSKYWLRCNGFYTSVRQALRCDQRRSRSGQVEEDDDNTTEVCSGEEFDRKGQHKTSANIRAEEASVLREKTKVEKSSFKQDLLVARMQKELGLPIEADDRHESHVQAQSQCRKQFVQPTALLRQATVNSSRRTASYLKANAPGRRKKIKTTIERCGNCYPRFCDCLVPQLTQFIVHKQSAFNNTNKAAQLTSLARTLGWFQSVYGPQFTDFPKEVHPEDYGIVHVSSSTGLRLQTRHKHVQKVRSQALQAEGWAVHHERVDPSAEDQIEDTESEATLSNMDRYMTTSSEPQFQTIRVQEKLLPNSHSALHSHCFNRGDLNILSKEISVAIQVEDPALGLSEMIELRQRIDPVIGDQPETAVASARTGDTLESLEARAKYSSNLAARMFPWESADHAGAVIRAANMKFSSPNTSSPDLTCLLEPIGNGDPTHWKHLEQRLHHVQDYTEEDRRILTMEAEEAEKERSRRASCAARNRQQETHKKLLEAGDSDALVVEASKKERRRKDAARMRLRRQKEKEKRALLEGKENI